MPSSAAEMGTRCMWPCVPGARLRDHEIAQAPVKKVKRLREGDRPASVDGGDAPGSHLRQVDAGAGGADTRKSRGTPSLRRLQVRGRRGPRASPAPVRPRGSDAGVGFPAVPQTNVRRVPEARGPRVGAEAREAAAPAPRALPARRGPE